MARVYVLAIVVGSWCTLSMKSASSVSKVLLVARNTQSLSAIRRALAEGGAFEVFAMSGAEVGALAGKNRPDRAILDLGVGSQSDLDLLSSIRALNPQMRIVVVADYVSIAAAVEVIKRGASDYLQKPVSKDALLRSLMGAEQEAPAVAAVDRSSLHRLEWEHIHRTLRLCAGNVSAAARALRMHRRTLQRKLRHPPAGNTRPAESG